MYNFTAGFSMQIRRFAASFDDLNSSPAQSSGMFSSSKVLQNMDKLCLQLFRVR